MAHHQVQCTLQYDFRLTAANSFPLWATGVKAGSDYGGGLATTAAAIYKPICKLFGVKPSPTAVWLLGGMVGGAAAMTSNGRRWTAGFFGGVTLASMQF